MVVSVAFGTGTNQVHANDIDGTHFIFTNSEHLMRLNGILTAIVYAIKEFEL